MWGADAAELDQLASDIAERAQRIERSTAAMTRAIHSAPWHGRNAERFRQQWDGEYRRALHQAARFLEQGSALLRRNADDQREASSSRDGAISPRHRYGPDGVVPVKWFDFGDGKIGEWIRLLLGALPVVGEVIIAEDLLEFFGDVIHRRSSAQDAEDRIMDIIGGIPILKYPFMAKDAIEILMPDQITKPIFEMIGMDPPIDNMISDIDRGIHGRWREIDPWENIPVVGPIRIGSIRDLYSGLMSPGSR